MTQIISLIGYPLKHSVSPHFQQAALDHYSLDVHYEARETEAETLASVVNELRQPQYLGANVTIPYKEAVLPLLDETDDLAGLVSAVNTIVNREGRLIGFNTDTYGFIRALREDAEFEPKNMRAIVLGAGGAARAVSFALLREGIRSLVIVNRTLSRAEKLVCSLREYVLARGSSVDVVALPRDGSKLGNVIKDCHLIVNCTVLGMKHSACERESPLPAHLIHKDVLVYDLVYNPLWTPLLSVAKEVGAKAINGLPMLVYQGAASFELWTGREAPIDIMLSAAKQALPAGGD
ncbi:MAG TPA: shikimate dehydrogenase [Dehalococcoidia bacterium]|nr:shikimate dehydrogenase [Dehalococcoidia bacterium]